MVISFSGPQCSGKTTLLKHIRDKNPTFNYVDEVTRYVKDRFKVDINEEGNDITQALIGYAHVVNLFKIDNKNINIFDRCSLDGLVYSTYLHYDANIVKEDIAKDAGIIFDNTVSKYDIIFYTDPKDVVLVQDGTRSVNPKFRNKIIELFDLAIDYPIIRERLYKLSGTVEDRLKQIQKILQQRGYTINI